MAHHPSGPSFPAIQLGSLQLQITLFVHCASSQKYEEETRRNLAEQTEEHFSGEKSNHVNGVQVRSPAHSRLWDPFANCGRSHSFVHGPLSTVVPSLVAVEYSIPVWHQLNNLSLAETIWI